MGENYKFRFFFKILVRVSGAGSHVKQGIAMRVLCDVQQTELDGDYGSVDGISATCSRCGHETQSFGTGEASIKRCLVLMREECPEGEKNFYVESSE
jgi:hypothetical protein